MEGSKKYWDVKLPSHWKYYKSNQNNFEYHTLRPGECPICRKIFTPVQEEEVKEIKIRVN